MSQKTEFVLTAKDETQAAFNSVNDALSKLSGGSVNLASSFKDIGLAAVGLTGVASFAALSSKITDAISGLGELKEAAERTGASVENLSGLKSVAKIGGRDFESIEAAIGKLNKALHATDDESKGAGKALGALGLDMANLRKMDPAEAFYEIAKAQEKFADGGGKSALMMAALGKNGAAMIPFMHDLAEQMSLTGRATTEQAKAADEYEKNVKRLNAAWGSLSRQMAAAVVGPAKDITDWMVKGQKEGGAFNAVLVGIGATLIKLNGGEINPMKIADANATKAFNDVEFLRKTIAKTQQDIDDGNTGIFGKGFADKRLASLKEELSLAERVRNAAVKHRDVLVRADEEANKPKSNALDSQTFGTPAAKEKAKVDDSYDKLIQSINEKIAAQQMEEKVGRELTEGEKLSAKTMEDLAQGYLVLKPIEEMHVKAGLEMLVMIDKRNAARKGEAESVQYLAEIQKRFNAENDAKRDAMSNLPASVARLHAELRKVDEIAASASDKFAKMMGDGKLTAEQFAEKMAELTAKTDAQKAAVTELNAVQDRMNASWQTGADKAITAYGDKAKNVAAQTEEAFTRAFSGMEDALINFAKTGKLDFNSLADSIISDILRIQAKSMISQSLSGGGWLSGLFGNGAPAGTSDAGPTMGIGDWFTKIFANAKGGVYNAPGLSAYSGQVVSKPTIFPFARGAGLMGEAGPEAIMPLRRGADGRLGVSGAGTAVEINVHNTVSGAQASATSRTDAGGKTVIDIMIETVKGALVNDIGSGGVVAGALESQYALNRAARAWR